MADRQATPSSAQSSQQSTVEDVVMDTPTDASSTPTSSYEPTKHAPDKIQADIELIATYLVKERAPDLVQAALGRVQNAYSRRAVRTNENSTEQAIRQLQATVQQLVTKVENTPNSPIRPNPGSYAEAAKLGLPTQTRAQQSLNATHVTPQKPVPARHKREIIVVRGTETPEEKARSYKELLEQLNRPENAGEVVAIRRLPTGDMTLTMEDEQARTNWLKDTKWLETFGAGARIKRRQFAVLAHGIRISQIQNQEQAIQEIYKQNPKLQGSVEIVRVAFAKKTLRSGRTTGPLIISTTEPEQANCLIDAGLIWQYELHNCEPFEGDCIITQCFRCYQYKHVGHKCHNLQRCGFCAAPGHATNECLGKEDRTKHRCILCKENHPAWARECRERIKQAEVAKLAYNTRPVRYQANPGFVRQTQFQFGSQSLSGNSLEQSTEEPWIEVGSKRTFSQRRTSVPPAKRPRGRPLGSTRASRNTEDIRTFASTQ
jgi:hypothetical protein